jgi:hypothetical protein
MYHPVILLAVAQTRHDDLLRESAGNWRVNQSRRSGGDRPPTRRILAHPRLVTAAVTLLVAFGVTAI